MRNTQNMTSRPRSDSETHRCALARALGAIVRFSALLLLSINGLRADDLVYDLESLVDGTSLTTQISGLTFGNSIVLSSRISLNEYEFPAHSGVNAVSDNGGPITIVFESPVQSFAAYFTYGRTLNIQAFNEANQQVAAAVSRFSNNEALSGVSGSVPNEFLSVTSSQGISSVTITAAATGGSFVMDDLTTSATSPCIATGGQNTTISDVQAEINEALGARAPVHDLNNDGRIDAVDVQVIINAAVGLGCA